MKATPPVILSNSDNPAADNRLREFAHQLAKIHEVIPVSATGKVDIPHPQKADLLDHLNVWEQALRNANAIFKAVPSNDLPVSRAGEWMLDNYYVVKQTFRQIEENLPASFLVQLPKLAGKSLRGSPGSSTGQGHPRIFALAREWIRCIQSRFELPQAIAFIQDYQQMTPLRY